MARNICTTYGFKTIGALIILFMISCVPKTFAGDRAVEQILSKDLMSMGVSWDASAKLEIRCPPEMGDGYTPSFSKRFYAHYVRRDFSKQALCVALASEWVRYDPSNGKPIKRYIPLLGNDYAYGPYPFHLPDCFKAIKVLEKATINNMVITVWTPTGCKQRYNLMTGERLGAGKEHIKVTTPDTEGDAGDEVDYTGESTISGSRLERLLRGE